MKTRYIIKTVDGNRYETDEVPVWRGRFSIDSLAFSSRDGNGTVYVNIDNIVSITEKEVEE